MSYEQKELVQQTIKNTMNASPHWKQEEDGRWKRVELQDIENKSNPEEKRKYIKKLLQFIYR